ncbi:cytochrome P460 family protein [Aestuariirhabdus litorea]|nr:cytochrome P460 family protein [Aestuariirhabdus litorea]
MKRLVPLVAAALSLLIGNAQAGPENVKSPGDYRANFTHYYSGDRTANNTQIIRVYANDIALEGAKKEGKLPYGSVLVGELYSAKLDASGQPLKSSLGRRIANTLEVLVVMERGAGFDADYPEALKVGDWEFAVFSPDGQRLDKDITACRACHNPLSDQEFLFSYDHLK